MRGTIVQPRAYAGDGVQTWEFSSERVNQHAQDILDTLDKDHLKAGEHCRWCPALTVCPENLRHALALAQAEFADVRGDKQRLVELMEIAPAVKAFLDAIPGMIMELFRRGDGPPGWKVVERKSHRRMGI